MISVFPKPVGRTAKTSACIHHDIAWICSVFNSLTPVWSDILDYWLHVLRSSRHFAQWEFDWLLIRVFIVKCSDSYRVPAERSRPLCRPWPVSFGGSSLSLGMNNLWQNEYIYNLFNFSIVYINEFVQERCNSNADVLELCLDMNILLKNPIWSVYKLHSLDKAAIPYRNKLGKLLWSVNILHKQSISTISLSLS